VEILSIRQRRGGELDREGAGRGHTACQCTVPTWRGARGLEARRPHTVSAKKEEAEALREALSPGAWRQHHGGVAALIAVDRRSKATRRLGGNVACQGFIGEAAGEGMRWQLSEAWMEHLGIGHGRNITSGQRGEEQTQAGSGDGKPRRTTANATAQGGTWTRGHPYGSGW
jgi:hypothetical protein